MHRLFMDIMGNGQEVRGSRVRGRDDAMHKILGDLVGFGGGVQVILGVKVEVRDVVPKSLHSGLASSVA